VDYHKTDPNPSPLVPVMENNCIELDPLFDRQFGMPDEPEMPYHFFQMINPATFMIKLRAVKRRQDIP